MKPRQWILTAAILFVAVLGTLMAPAQSRSQTHPLWREGDGREVSPELERISNAFVRLAGKVRPAVVQLRVTLNPAEAQDGEGQRPASSRGSGFIIHPEGYILTANHMVCASTARGS